MRGHMISCALNMAEGLSVCIEIAQKRWTIFFVMLSHMKYLGKTS